MLGSSGSKSFIVFVGNLQMRRGIYFGGELIAHLIITRGRILLLLSMLVLPGCTHYIFYPMEEHVLEPDALGVSYEDIYVETSDNIRLHGWKLFAKDQATGTLLFFHGNAENISTHFTNVYWLTEHGYDVYLFDYRGYGKSEGEAELGPIVDDMELLIGYVLEAIPVKERIVVIGQSLGASLAIHAVAHTQYKERIAALVSVAAFSDYHDITQDVLAKSWIFWLFQWPLSKTVDNSYSPLKSIDNVAPIPTIILHSQQDEIIDYYHALKLYDSAQRPKQLVTLGGGHNYALSTERNRQALLNTLQTVSAH